MGEKGRLQTSQLQKVVRSIEDVVGASEYKLCSTKMSDYKLAVYNYLRATLRI